jgi:hypothetical protein
MMMDDAAHQERLKHRSMQIVEEGSAAYSTDVFRMPSDSVTAFGDPLME